MTDEDARTPFQLRIPGHLLAEIDARIAQTNIRRVKSGEPKISRNEWFINMTRWVIADLPHQATRADLIKAWPNLPEEALGIEK